jgi:EAL domain-containing protein (putative c-di-GMP-specific phosphodiesterase class I)/ActR/RegA family two-component response regulator
MTDNANRLLVVDDEPAIVDFIRTVADRLGFAVASAVTRADFLTLVESFRPTVMILDLNLPETDGVELLRMLGARSCNSQMLLMSGVDERVLTAAHEIGAAQGLAMCGVLAKPVLPEDLQEKLVSLMQQDTVLDAAELRRGLAAGELVPYYQPKARLNDEQSWTIDAVEALVRWQHPRLGLVMPDEFIPIAERSGLIGDLTAVVLAQALHQLRDWNNQGLRLRCAVNLPPSLVTDLSFPDNVAALLAHYDLDPSQLSLEITETATMQDPTKAMDILTRLRVKRIGLSLDDFGTGFSSLTRLYQMPFDEMKIDKSLVMNMPHSREANTIVSSMIELGHNLGLKICAEGVENRAALEMLGILGCDSAQGFFISRAVAASDIPTLVAHWNREQPTSSCGARPRVVV